MSIAPAASSDQRTWSERKRLGLFYTPGRLARILTDWALPPDGGRVLDPSFGGCSFLRAALETLIARGCPRPARFIFGIDIDAVSARRAAVDLQQAGIPARNFIYGDFLRIEPPRSERGRYSAIVGNPPYVRHSRLDRLTALAGESLMSRTGVRIPRRASLWAYFLLHSLAYLRQGGRLAFLLPGSSLQADYARPVLRSLAASFASVTLIRLEEQVFPEADEETVVLLADLKGDGSAGLVRYLEATCVADLEDFLSGRTLEGTPLDLADPGLAAKRAVLPEHTWSAWVKALSRESVTTLGSVAHVRIGIVTGANEFFLRDLTDPLFESGCLPSLPAVTCSSWLRAPIWRGSDQRRRELGGARCRLLVLQPDAQLPAQLVESIRRLEQKGVASRNHCQRRSPWWALRDRLAPDVFLPYMGASSPELVLNEAGAVCTNAIHRLWWREPKPVRSCGLVASSWSSLFSFAAELYGRHYGGGILKLEPSAARKLPLVPHGTRSLLRKIDALARQGRREEAAVLADREILEGELRLRRAEVLALREGAEILSRRRLRSPTR